MSGYIVGILLLLSYTSAKPSNGGFGGYSVRMPSSYLEVPHEEPEADYPTDGRMSHGGEEADETEQRGHAESSGVQEASYRDMKTSDAGYRHEHQGQMYHHGRRGRQNYRRERAEYTGSGNVAYGSDGKFQHHSYPSYE